jgi:hypothetical protein
MLEHALPEIIRVYGPDHPSALGARLQLDDQRLLVGRTAGLEADLESMVELATPPGGRRGWLIFARETLGRVRTAAGHPRDAETLLREALDRRRKEPTAVYNLALSEQALAECLEAQKKVAEAQPLYHSSYDRLKKLLGPEAYVTRQAAQHLK